MHALRSTHLIARTVLIEAVRRKEIYAIVLGTLILIAAVMTVDFFRIEGLVKFYREISLQCMSIATALTVVVLACRQLPREFETRTIYPLLAKPVSRFSFLLGKVCGVMLAAAFCMGLFLSVFIAGSLYLKAPIYWGLLAQYAYLQMLSMLIMATLCFFLSVVMNLDAAITLGVLFYACSSIITTAQSVLWDYVEGLSRSLLLVMTYALPHLTLFDLSDRFVHGDVWTPVEFWVLRALTIYSAIFSAIFFVAALLMFRRKPL